MTDGIEKSFIVENLLLKREILEQQYKNTIKGLTKSGKPGTYGTCCSTRQRIKKEICMIDLVLELLHSLPLNYMIQEENSCLAIDFMIKGV